MAGYGHPQWVNSALRGASAPEAIHDRSFVRVILVLCTILIFLMRPVVRRVLPLGRFVVYVFLSP